MNLEKCHVRIFVVSTASADGLVLDGARAFACTMLINVGYCIYLKC